MIFIISAVNLIAIGAWIFILRKHLYCQLIVSALLGLFNAIATFFVLFQKYGSHISIIKHSMIVPTTFGCLWFIVTVILAIYILRDSFRNRAEDELDAQLLELGMMPINPRAQRRFRRKRKKQQKSSAILPDVTYVHIYETPDIYNHIYILYKTSEPESLPSAIFAYSESLARNNNPDLDWENPTMEMSRNQANDIRVLYDMIHRIQDIEEQQ